MPFKRLIFSLLYLDGKFCLSRNFRLQRVGDIKWLLKNYDLKSLCSAIDELFIINLGEKSFNQRYNQKFFEDLNKILECCYCPVVIAGGISTKEDAKILFDSGADKISICSAIFEKPFLLIRREGFLFY